jgi:hypothetical protein
MAMEPKRISDHPPLLSSSTSTSAHPFQSHCAAIPNVVMGQCLTILQIPMAAIDLEKKQNKLKSKMDYL